MFWEFKRTGWETVKAFKDAHNSPVTSATFVEGNTQLALTGDAQGRLVSHNVTAYLSITAIFAGVPFATSCQQHANCIILMHHHRTKHLHKAVTDPGPNLAFELPPT